MAPLAVLFGGLLVGLGLLAHQHPEKLGAGAAHEPTALIPAYFGAAMLVAGLAALAKPAAVKHAMHAAALVGVLGLLGGLYPVFKGEADFGKASVVTGVLMAVLCGAFTLLCVRSFVQARLARSELGTTE